jgi:hypothetical protein
MKEHLPVSQQYSELLVETGISTWKSVGDRWFFLGIGMDMNGMWMMWMMGMGSDFFF